MADLFKEAFMRFASKIPEYKNMSSSQLNKIYNQWLVDNRAKMINGSINQAKENMKNIISNTGLSGMNKTPKPSAGYQAILSEGVNGKPLTESGIDKLGDFFAKQITGVDPKQTKIPVRYNNMTTKVTPSSIANTANVTKDVATKVANTAPKLTFGKVATPAFTAGQGIYEMLYGSSPANRVIGGLQALGTGLSYVPHPFVKYPGMVLQYGAPIGYYAFRDKSNKSDKKESTKTNNNKQEEDGSYYASDIPSNDQILGGHYSSPSNIGKFLYMEGDGSGWSPTVGSNNSLPNLPSVPSNQITQPQQSNQQYSQQQSNQQSQKQDISDVLEQYKQYLQEANGPQIEAIQNFLDRYPKMYDDYNRQKRFWNAFSAYSGEPIYKENAIDPREQELARIQLINQLQQLKTGNLDKLNVIRGNIAIANALGLDDETALADKNMLDLYGKLKQYESMLEGKEYTADKNLEGKKYSSNMGYMGKTYSADRGYDTAIDKQKLYNNMRMNTSILGGVGNISSYGMDPSQFIEIANQLSKYGLKITPQEQAGLNQSGTGLYNQ